MKELDSDKLRNVVRERYTETVKSASCCCRPGPSASCCGSSPSRPDAVNQLIGYSDEELGSVVEGANLGLGCGNPVTIGNLKPGDVVLDLGSGGGFDCFLAAEKVGEEGRVIGVDMTPEMVSKARENAVAMGAANVSFRLGEIEYLPVADNHVDVIISNCVINLSPEKGQVFKEAFRVLKSGGRLAISDMVATAEMPDALREQTALLTGCVAGAEHIDRLQSLLAAAGFEAVNIALKPFSRELVAGWFPGSGVEQYVASADIEALKP